MRIQSFGKWALVIVGTTVLTFYGYNCSQSDLHTDTDTIPVMGSLRAFPGAGGFGASASGGRGGRVIAVTTLAPRGPGSLHEALTAIGPRTIVFKVSGVIDAIADISHGNVTIAGQTSPCGVIVRGLVCDTVYDTGKDCDNLIVRHLRSRPSTETIRSATRVLDDAIRLDGVSNVMLDHVEASAATDEALQISGSNNVSVQSSIFAETIGEHAQYGGVLMNYSSSSKPLQNVSLVGNLWYHLGGRLPEISCEDNDRYGESNCADSRFHLELSRNYYVDPGAPIWFENGNSSLRYLDLNWFGNEFNARRGFSYGMISAGFVEEFQNVVFAAGNRMNLYPTRLDLDLAYCCGDFNASAPATRINATISRSRHAFPDLGRWDSIARPLKSEIVATAGPFPRDPRSQRYIRSVESGTIPTNPYSSVASGGTNADAYSPPTECTRSAPVDADGDGMSDAWETAHGLSPRDPTDGNATELSPSLMGAEGYTNLEAYLQHEADELVR